MLIADDVTAAVKELRKTAKREVRREVGLIARGPVATRLIRKLSIAPPPFRGKRIWASAKQRRAYFATDGFGKGIPYRRTGELERGWRVVVGEGATILVENSTPYASYVEGNDQQPMHVQGGWQYAPVTINDFVDEFENAMIDGWYRVVERVENRI